LAAGAVLLLLGAYLAWRVVEVEYWVRRAARADPWEEEWYTARDHVVKLGQRAAPALVRMMVESRGPNAVENCTELLGKVGGDRACRCLLDLVRSPVEDEVVWALNALSEWGDHSEWGQEPKRPQRPLPSDMREELVREVLRLGRAAVARLAADGVHDDLDDAPELLRAVHRVIAGFDDERIAEWAKELLSSPDVVIRSLGYGGIRRSKDPSLIPILEEKLQASYRKFMFENDLIILKLRDLGVPLEGVELQFSEPRD
jgi:hypothetical protein